MLFFKPSPRKSAETNRSEDTCPDCNGKGFPPEALSDPVGFSSFDTPPCQRCRGAGTASPAVESTEPRETAIV